MVDPPSPSHPAPPIEVPLDERPRLLTRIDSAIDTHLAVLVGPIGSGITTALDQWCRRERPHRNLRILDADDPLTTVVEAERERGEDVTIVVDEACDRSVPELRRVIEDLDADPGSVRLLLGGSPDIINPIGWALTNRADRVITAEELWFDRDEIARCAGLDRGSRKTDGVLDYLEELTLGWPIAVVSVLAASWSPDDLNLERNGFGLPACPDALTKRFHARLERDGLADLLELLGRIAPFPWLDGERLAAVVDDRAAVSLESLRSLGLPTDPRRDGAPPGAWRPHPLLRAVGHAHLRGNDSVLAGDIVRRAARRFTVERDFAAALGCLRELDDGREIVRLAVDHLHDLAASGLAEQVVEALGEAPWAELLAVPFGVINHGLLLRLVGDEAGARRVWSGLDSDRLDGGRPRYDGATVKAILTACGIGFGRHPEVVRNAVESVLGPPDAVPSAGDPPPRFGEGELAFAGGFLGEDVWESPWHLDPVTVHAFLCASGAEADLRRGDVDGARRWVERGRRLSDRDVRTVAVLDAIDAAVAVERGLLDRAASLARSASTGLGTLAPFVPTIDPRITLAHVFVDRVEDGAEELLAESEAAARRIGAFNRIAAIELLHARIALATGRYRPGLRTLEEASVLRDIRTAPDLRRRAEELRILLVLRLGDLALAERLAAVGAGPEIRAAFAIAAGREQKLRVVVDTWPASDDPADRARWLAVSAHHAASTGATDSLVEHLGELARTILRHGYLQPVLDLGVDLDALVRKALEVSDEMRIEHLARHLDNRVDSGDRIRLSPRELEVLEGIAGFIPDDELAERMGVRPSTVKSHHRSIFRKLKVRNRGEAVRRAEDLGLLAPRPSRSPIR